MTKKNIIYDGINIFTGLQGEGKSYVCTYKAVQELLNPKQNRKVISNYPIIVRVPFTFKQKFINYILTVSKKEYLNIKLFKKEIKLIKQIQEIKSSFIWNDSYTTMAVKNALILLDESGADKYTGSYAYELTKEDRTFFSRLRHNNNSVFLMSPTYEDIHPFIRRRMAYLHAVSKLKLPLYKEPFNFHIDTYTSIKNFLKRDDYKIHKKAKKTRFNHESIRFSKLIGTSYNTHFFKDIRPEPEYISWYNPDTNSLNDTVLCPIVIEKPLNKNVIKDSISTLVKLNKWTKKDASIEVNKIVIAYELDEIDTVEKILRIALKRRSKILENIDETYYGIINDDGEH